MKENKENHDAETRNNKEQQTLTSNGLATLGALLCKKIPVAVSTVRLLILGGELEAGELLTATGTGEAFLVPGVALIRDSTTANDFGAFGAALCILSLVAGNTDHLVVTGNETFRANRLFAFHAHEAFFVPLLTTVLVLPHARLEDALAAITASRKALVITVGTVELVILRRKGAVRQRRIAGGAFETLFMPVSLFEGEILLCIRRTKRKNNTAISKEE